MADSQGRPWVIGRRARRAQLGTEVGAPALEIVKMAAQGGNARIVGARLPGLIRALANVGRHALDLALQRGDLPFQVFDHERLVGRPGSL